MLNSSIKIRRSLPYLVIGSLTGAGVLNSCFSLKAEVTAKARQPNVIFILTDDQGYGDFSVHGNPVLHTPALDKLHSQSIRLTDFHSAPMSTPTRGQLMTGRDALDNGADRKSVV